MKTLKEQNQLHPQVLERLRTLLSKLDPDSAPIPEVCGVLGGRNDLILFFADGRRMAFELFATVSPVSQDLRLLEQASANVKIAILLDREIDPQPREGVFSQEARSLSIFVVVPGNETAGRREVLE